MVATVTMKDGKSSLAVSTPFNIPIRAPAASVSAIAGTKPIPKAKHCDQSCHRDDRADGKIDLAEQDHPCHPEGSDRDNGDLLQDVHEVYNRHEARVEEGKDDAEHHQRKEDAAILLESPNQGGFGCCVLCHD
jgi:hypothetical protein